MEADHLPPPIPVPAPAPSSSTRSLSISSVNSLPRPSTSHQDHKQLQRDPGSGWREERGQLEHKLRIARAEIAHLQAKLGSKSNAAPFNSSSPRKSSLGGSELPAPPLRKPSSGDLGASYRRHRSATPDSGDGGGGGGYSFSHSQTSPRSPRGPMQLPEGSGQVSMNRAYLNDDPSGMETLQIPTSPSQQAPPSLDRSVSPTGSSSASYPHLRSNGLPSSSSHSSSNGGGGRSSAAAENPFFGSGASRERLSKSAASAQSGSGKVISGLQSDLLQARSALESTRGQLRLSQRAVEFLGRQSEDLKETRDRLTLEIDGLNRQLSRKERMQEESLGRARIAEKALGELQTEQREFRASMKEKVKGLEEEKRRSEEVRGKAEREYASLREGIKSMSDGWRHDLKWLKSDLAKSEKDLETKSSHLTKLLAARTNTSTTLSSTLTSLTALSTDFTKTHQATTSSALKELSLLSKRGEEEQGKAEELRTELGGLRKRMREYQEEEAEKTRAGVAAEGEGGAGSVKEARDGTTGGGAGGIAEEEVGVAA